MQNQFIILMGVSGSGKSTVSEALSRISGIPCFDGDNFHPQANIVKMASGQALTDADRAIFLKAINTHFRQLKANNQSGIISCSALKQIYRDQLSEGIESEIRFVFLEGSEVLIASRLAARKGHFMPSNLLKSQFEILEKPLDALTFSIELSPEHIASEIAKEIQKSEFALVGLGVMGKSLARNLARNGIELSLYNRFVPGKEEHVALNFISEFPELHKARGFEDLAAFVNSIQRPRKIFLMIQAGTQTDIFLDSLIPLLHVGDIIIDGGNSHYKDTKKRQELCLQTGLFFIGTGVSGGEQGALWGPSIMPSGDHGAYLKIKNYLETITASDYQGGACCTYIGKEGSGHFVKMIHNGIEYAEMQLIAEMYAIFRFGLGYDPDLIARVFDEWNKTHLKNYLLEITSHILQKKENQGWLIDAILDKAGNKGTGNWSSITAIEAGQPATMISSALFARYISTIKPKTTLKDIKLSNKRILELEASLKNAYDLARKINHEQGFRLIQTVSDENNWQLNLSEIARIWTNGCIIRSTLMEDFSQSFATEKTILDYQNLSKENLALKSNLKAVLIEAIKYEIPVPSLSEALQYMTAMDAKVATANIIQAQRDYFGAHTYQRIDDASGKFYHTDWLI